MKEEIRSTSRVISKHDTRFLNDVNPRNYCYFWNYPRRFNETIPTVVGAPLLLLFGVVSLRDVVHPRLMVNKFSIIR